MLFSLKKLISVLTLIILISACSGDEFLNESPVSSIGTSEFFQNSDQFESAVNAAYTNLQDLYGSGGDGGIGGYGGGYWAYSEMRSDNTTFQDNTQDLSGHPWWYLDQFIMEGSSDITLTTWNLSYQGIGKCNIVLQNIEEADVENKSRYIAEAKFLRALYYFHLVRYYGDVPLVTSSVQSPEEAFAQNERTPKDQVYELIISDLNEAKANLPQSYSEQDQGRATEGAARTLLAKVYMWRDQYGDAQEELREVMNMGYSLLSDYSAIFDKSNENNEEVIFSIQYIEGPNNLGSVFTYRFLPWNISSQVIGHSQNTARTGMQIPTKDLLEAFEENDLRRTMIDTLVDEATGVVDGNLVPYTTKFMDPGHSQRLISGQNFQVFRYSHVLLMLAETYARTGGGNPVPLINQIRRRAGLEELTGSYSQEELLDIIIKERRLEFHAEADRWDVLVRTGRAIEVMEAHGEREAEAREEIGINAFQDIKLLFPIPDPVIELDPEGISQNEEYL